MEATENALGELLRTLRQRSLLTQEELAERAGVSVGTIAGLETGRSRRPRGGSVRLLADALGLTGPDRDAFTTAAGGAAAVGGAVDGGAAEGAGAEGAGRTAGVGRAAVPAQLPADLAEFTGRADTLKRLAELLPDEPDTATGGESAERAEGADNPDEAPTSPPPMTIVAIAGTAGVGKTTLAVHWAHGLARRYPDGQLYANLRGFDPAAPAASPVTVLRGFLAGLGVAPDRMPEGLDSHAALYRSLLAGRRVLVVLDNARDAAQVRPLLPGTAGCLVVVTSRTEPTGLVAAHGAHPVVLDLPGPDEARELFVRRLGRDRVAAEPDAVDEIVRRCARLPLALAVTAARAAARPGFPLAALAAQLREARDGLDAWDGSDPATDVRAVFSWSYRELSVEAARLFRALGDHPGPDIGVPAATSLTKPTATTKPHATRPPAAGLPPGETRAARAKATRAALAELTAAHLLTEHEPGRYAMHDLLRAFAAEQAREHDTAGDRAGTRRRMLDHYLHTAFAAANQLDPNRDPIDLLPAAGGVVPEPVDGTEAALGWFATEYPTLLAALDVAAAAGHDAHAWQLAWAMQTLFHRRGLWHDQSCAMRTALAAAGRLGDRSLQARAHRYLGVALARAGDPDGAYRHYRQALDLFEALGDRLGQARSHLDLAWVQGLRSGHAGSQEHNHRALALFDELDHDGGRALALNNIGYTSALLGEHRAALDHCRRALALHERSGDRWAQGTTWDSLGYAHHHLAEYPQARHCYGRALELYRAVGERYHEAETLTHLGDTHAAAGDRAAALGAYRQALTIYDELGHPDASGVRERLTRSA